MEKASSVRVVDLHEPTMSDNQKKPLPRMTQTRDSIDVDLRWPAPGQRTTLPVRGVLDYDDEGRLLGIEILNLVDQGGTALLDPWRSSDPPFSYDPDADAFYARLLHGRAPRQRSMDVFLRLDENGGLVGITIPRTPDSGS